MLLKCLADMLRLEVPVVVTNSGAIRPAVEQWSFEYLDRYTPEQRRRHDVRPGITGLAQVSGRQHLRFSQRLELDVEYVDSWSVVLDVVILWRTVRAVAGGSGVESGQAIADVDDLGLYQGKETSSDDLNGKEETFNESGEA